MHLVGFSLGGMVAMRLAARDPDLVASVTLGNTTARANPGTKVAPYLSVALLMHRTWQQRRSQLDRTCANPRRGDDPP